jgi:uncharacterized circularly permuted ATP-grasp superfamily protein/uncharacterized alpha-E superfamily protein
MPDTLMAAYDEAVSGQGSIRAHWREMMALIWAMPPEMLREKQARAAAHLAGADNFMADFGSSTQPIWSIDVLPLIIPGSEWRTIAAGLTQRARLLDLILRDIYGPQDLIREQLLPPHLIYANPGFLRPLRNILPAGTAPQLHFYAADLTRMPDGAWRILADRTQAPAGVGYALRHRGIVARTFPEALRHTPVRRLQPFLDTWQDSLNAIGGAISDNPRIVLLTPGPHNNAYPEHVLLAHELGITLAQGSDLTVRDSVVYLKTLDGLVRVDVIYRRVDGEYCDPLELRGDSALGVAGMVAAMRAGNVALLNAPGSAVIELPALAPFLPGLARHLLGEELALPAVTTWWCGQKSALDEVLAHISRFVIQHVFEPNSVPVDPAEMTDSAKAALAARIKASPESYVAIERVDHARTPAVGTGGVEPRPFVIRTCSIWHHGQWSTMPGAMARLTDGDEGRRVALRSGGQVKDVWILADGGDAPEATPADGTPHETRKVERAAELLGSRTADDLFWLGRYIERLDSAVRQFRAVLQRLIGGSMSPRDIVESQMLAHLMQHAGWIPATTARAPVDSSMFAHEIANAAGSVGALADCHASLQQLGLSLRDRISQDMARALMNLVTDDAGSTERSVDGLLARMDRSVTNIAAFGGLVAENMTRGSGWRFLEFGRRIERGLTVCDIVESLLSGHMSRTELSMRLVLELCDSTITYRRRYPTDHYSLIALTVILSDATNPRALNYQMDSIGSSLGALVGYSQLGNERASVSDLIATIEDLCLHLGDEPEPTALTYAHHRETIRAALVKTRDGLETVSETLSRQFLAHIDPVRSLYPGSATLIQEGNYE